MRNAPRAGVVQATDESPQAVANDERDAHGSADSHVRHVLEVNGRDAAQNRKAEVQRTARVHAEGRNDARWLGAGIEDEPKPVLAIQLARLGRDVGGRIVQPEIRLERRFLRLGVNGAMPVLVESIEQDSLEPGDAPHLLNDDVRELGGRDHALNPQQRRPERVVHRDGWTARIRLELENGRPLVAVDDSVELLSVRADLQRVHVVPALLAQRLPHLGDRRRIDHRGERPTQDLFDTKREMIADVLADLRDGQRRLGQHEQHAKGLDRPRDVDGLAVTVSHVHHGVSPRSRTDVAIPSTAPPIARKPEKSRAPRRRSRRSPSPRAPGLRARRERGATSPASPPRRR